MLVGCLVAGVLGLICSFVICGLFYCCFSGVLVVMLVVRCFGVYCWFEVWLAVFDLLCWLFGGLRLVVTFVVFGLSCLFSVCCLWVLL